jgi:hypothetical protein
MWCGRDPFRRVSNHQAVRRSSLLQADTVVFAVLSDRRGSPRRDARRPTISAPTAP